MSYRFETIEQLLEWTAKTGKLAELESKVARMSGENGIKPLLDAITEIREVRMAHQHLFEVTP